MVGSEEAALGAEVEVGGVGAVDGQEAAGGVEVPSILYLEDQGPTSTEDQVIHQGGIQ